MLRRALPVAAATILLAGPSQATVYTWRDASGVHHYTNRADDVPAGPLDAYRTFEDAPPPVADAAVERPPEEEPEASPVQAYAQGVDEGLRLAAEQAERERELAADAPPVEVEVLPAAPEVYVTIVPADDAGYGVVDGCAYGGCWPWIGGPVVFAGPFRGHRHLAHGGRGFARHGGFAGGHPPHGHGGHGGHGGGHGGGGRGGLRGR